MSSIPVIATAVVLIMLKNIGNAISRLAMDRFGRNLSGRNTSCPRHVGHDAVAMARAVA